MHLGNGAITPECAALTFGAAGLGLATALAAVRRSGMDRRQACAAGVLGAAVFAAQTLNVPLLPFSSAHLVGGVLLAWMLGPALGALTMALVLTVQALVLGDGGVLALGANVLNMALLPAGLVWFARRTLASGAAAWRTALAVGCSAGLAVFLAAGLIVGEVALFRSPAGLDGLGAFAAQMLGAHAWFGLAEGLVTVGLLGLLGSLALPGLARLNNVRLGGSALAALLLAVAAVCWGSQMPDGYEHALASSGLDRTVGSLSGLNAQVHAWQEQVNGCCAVPEIWRVLGAAALAGLAAGALAAWTGVRRTVAQKTQA